MSADFIQKDDLILITGSNGFIGVSVVRSLLDRGFTRLRCFVRPSSKLARLEEVLRSAQATSKVEIVSGDLMSPVDCERAAADVTVVYHLAAGFDKSFAGAFMNSVLSTRNLMDACLQRGRVRRFVNVSSFAVYSNLSMNRGAVLDETAPLEDAPQERFDAYAFGKLKQEQIVQDYGRRHQLPYVILRPGTVFGPGKRDLTGRIGIDTFGVFLHIGGSNLLPLTYVDNCAEAIVRAADRRRRRRIFNVVDDDLPSSPPSCASTSVASGRSHRSTCPMPPATPSAGSGNPIQSGPTVSFPRRSIASAGHAYWKKTRYSNEKLKTMLGWTQEVPTHEALTRYYKPAARRSDQMLKGRHRRLRQDRGRARVPDPAHRGGARSSPSVTRNRSWRGSSTRGFRWAAFQRREGDALRCEARRGSHHDAADEPFRPRQAVPGTRLSRVCREAVHARLQGCR